MAILGVCPRLEIKSFVQGQDPFWEQSSINVSLMAFTSKAIEETIEHINDATNGVM